MNKNKKYRAIIAGGRKYRLTWEDVAYLNSEAWRIAEVVTGDCKTGADADAKEWADDLGIPVITFPADWGNLGKSAGPIRNSAMVEFVTTKTNLMPMLIAFPGGRGTADIIRKARAAGMEVVTL